MNILLRIENFLLAIWTGAMIGIGYIAAPVLFKILDDRAMAGNLAGHMFKIVLGIGLLVALFGLLLSLKARGFEYLKQWRAWILLLLAALVFLSLFVLQPMIADVKALGIEPGSENAKQFGMLHGLSSVFYLITTVSGCILIFAGLQKKDSQ